MAGEWTVRPLEDCMAALIDYRGRTPEKTSFGIPLITAKVVKGGRIETPDEFIAVDDYEPWMRRGIPKAGDVVITTEAPLGEVAQLGAERVALAQRLIALRGKPGLLENSFLKFLMQSEDVQDQLRARASGTTVLGIKQSELRKVLLALPPIEEQRAIAHILGTLDEKIELNRRMNETLEAMARAVFQSWFVDFDPVRAKAAGRDPGLPREIADLFPDRFEDSELGEIPAGWRVASVGDEVRLVKGVSYRSEQLGPSDTALVTLKSVNRGGGYRPDGLKAYTGDYKPEQIVNPRELVVAQTDVTQAAEVIGKPALVAADERYSVLVASLDLLIVRPETPDLSRSYFYLMFQTPAFQDHLYGHTNGTTVLHLSKTGVPTFQFAKPPGPLARLFTRSVDGIFDRAIHNESESRTLAALRDTLLPKLFSGELRLKNPDRAPTGAI